MSRLFFETAETLVYDPVAANRTATRSSLYNLGFRRIETVGTIESFLESVRRRPPDLAVCEAQGADEELCVTIQSIRQGTRIYNPFVVIIVAAWEQSNAFVSRVLASGADDLLLRPFSTAALGARIRSHIEHRKGFVITSDYIGPDRRRNSSRPSTAELFDPPNSLRMKAVDRLAGEEANQKLDQELKQARDLVTTEKLRRDVFQLCVLWRLLSDKSAASKTFHVDLSTLKAITRGIARRCQDTEFESAGMWCDSILTAIEGLESGVNPDPSIQILDHAALQLSAVFVPEKDSAEHIQAINATVAMVRERMSRNSVPDRVHIA